MIEIGDPIYFGFEDAMLSREGMSFKLNLDGENYTGLVAAANLPFNAEHGSVPKAIKDRGGFGYVIATDKKKKYVHITMRLENYARTKGVADVLYPIGKMILMRIIHVTDDKIMAAAPGGNVVVIRNSTVTMSAAKEGPSEVEIVRGMYCLGQIISPAFVTQSKVVLQATANHLIDRSTFVFGATAGDSVMLDFKMRTGKLLPSVTLTSTTYPYLEFTRDTLAYTDILPPQIALHRGIKEFMNNGGWQTYMLSTVPVRISGFRLRPGGMYPVLDFRSNSEVEGDKVFIDVAEFYMDFVKNDVIHKDNLVGIDVVHAHVKDNKVIAFCIVRAENDYDFGYAYGRCVISIDGGASGTSREYALEVAKDALERGESEVYFDSVNYENNMLNMTCEYKE